MKKSILILLALAVALCSLAGCGAQQAAPAQATEPEAAAEKIEVSLVSSYVLPDFEAGFEAAHPDIDLQIEELTTGTINGEIVRRLRNAHGPDLIVTNLPAGETSEYVYDLSSSALVEKYQSSITKSIQIDGHNYYLPLPGTYYGYIINKTLLDQLGLEVPETTEDILAVLAAAKEQGIGVSAENGYGFGLSDIGATFLGAYLTGDFATDFLSTAHGARWLASFAEKQSSFTGTWENSIAFLKACIDLGYIDPAKLIVLYNGRIDSDSTAFKAEEQLPGRTAILSFGNLDMLEKIRSKTQDEIMMLPCLPSSEEGNKLFSAVSNNFIAVNSALDGDQAQLNAALAVLDYLSSEEGQALWIKNSSCPHSYLNGYSVDTAALPENIASYVEQGMVFSNPFPTNLLSYMGKQLTAAAKGSVDISDALAALDDYYLNGSEDVEYDLSLVGTVAGDMLYENANTRKVETEIGNFVTDAIQEMTGADIVLVNGGGIRSSLYKGDVTGEDIANVCPYGNLIIVVETDGATLRAAITNGIQRTWRPGGEFLQVAGIKYSYKPAADETEVAELIELCYPDGSPVQDSDVFTLAYTNYMGGSSGYVDAGDGYTMLNVYDSGFPVTVKLISETGKTYGDAIKLYFANHSDKELFAALEGRITVVD